MYNSTGLADDQFDALYERLKAAIRNSLKQDKKPVQIPTVLGIIGALEVTLKYLRRNRVQAELAESHSVSQSTISRAITAVTGLLADCLAEERPTLGQVPKDTALLIDGTLLPCWRWKAEKAIFSGKHRHSGVNVQVITDTHGRLQWISPILEGSIHDVKAFDTHKILRHLKARNIIADKGYIGRGLHTPARAQPGRKLTGPEEDYSQRINHIRWPIERAIAHLKTWRILHTIYRRPYSTFQTTVNAITGIIFGIL